MKTDTTDRLQQIFRAVFNLPDDRNVGALTRSDVPEWDSLGHVMLVTAIESEFGITLDAGEQLRMTDFAATAALLSDRTP